MAECESRLFQIKAGCGGNTPSPGPTPTNPVPSPTTSSISTMPSFPPGVSVSGLGAIAFVNGQCFGSNGLISGGTGGIGQGPGQTGLPIGSPPMPPSIVQSVGLPSQAPDVNQDPTSWRIVESAGTVG